MYGILSLVIPLLITALIYAGIPLLITRVFVRKTLTRKTALIICIVNAVVWWSVFSFINIANGVEKTPNSFAAWLWSAIAYYLIPKLPKELKE